MFGSDYFCQTALKKGVTKMEVINVEVISAKTGDYLEIFTEDFAGKLEGVEGLKRSARLQGIKYQVADKKDPGSDAYPFLAEDIPAFSIDWSWSEVNHPYYHSKDDDYSNVNKESVEKPPRLWLEPQLSWQNEI